MASSDNAFADLGLLDAGEELLKSRLTLRTQRTIRQRGLSRAQAALPLE